MELANQGAETRRTSPDATAARGVAPRAHSVAVSPSDPNYVPPEHLGSFDAASGLDAGAKVKSAEQAAVAEENFETAKHIADF